METPKLTAQQVASWLGSRKSEKKAAASRINGKKGGWPKGRPRKVESKTGEPK